MNEPTSPRHRAEPTADESDLLDDAVHDLTTLIMYAAPPGTPEVIRRALLDAAGTRITEVLYP